MSRGWNTRSRGHCLFLFALVLAVTCRAVRGPARACGRAGAQEAGEDRTGRDKHGCSHGSTKHHSLFDLFSEEQLLKANSKFEIRRELDKAFLPSSGTRVWEEGIFKGSFCPGECLDTPLEPQTRGSVELRNVGLWVCSHSRSCGW